MAALGHEEAERSFNEGSAKLSLRSNQKTIIIWVVTAVMFMEMLDVSIINTAIPAIANAFHTSSLSLKFAVTSYILSLAIFIPASGFVADRYGTKTIFTLAIAVFTLGSILCGMSINLWQLTLFRAIQGLGGALMIPVARLIIVRIFPPEERMQATSTIVLPALLGPVFGPLLGGFFTEYISWRLIFFINIPIGIAAINYGFKALENEIASSTMKFDFTGFILSGVALACIALSFEAIGENVISTTTVAILAVTGFSSLFIFIIYAIYKKEKSILNLQLFKIRTFRAAILGNAVSILSFSGVTFILPLLFQLQFGMTPTKSGFLTASSAVGGVAIRKFVPQIVEKIGFKKTTMFTPLGICLSLVLLSFVTHESTFLYISVSGILLGVFGVLLFATNGPLVYVDIPHHLSSAAASMDSTVRQFMMSLAIALAALLLIIFLNIFKVPELSSQGSVKVFQFSLLFLAALSLVQILVSLGIKNDDGKNSFHH